MALPIPHLDDRSYDSLVAEGISLLPVHAPRWTNYNPSDPGITLIELLAYVCEALLFRLDQISRESKLGFLRLLSESQSDSGAYDASQLTVEDIDKKLRRAVEALTEPRRAVTAEDFERLSRVSADEAFGKGARTHCVVGLWIERVATGVKIVERPSDFTVVVVPPNGTDAERDAKALDKIRESLTSACLLCSRVQVIDGIYVFVSIDIVLRTVEARRTEDWLELARITLDRYFSPYGGDGQVPGWPFGRPVYISDVVDALQRIDGVAGVDDAKMIQVSMIETDRFRKEDVIGIQVGIRSQVSVTTRIGTQSSLGRDRLIRSTGGELIGISLRPYELVRVTLSVNGLRVVEEARPT